ncbi:class I SAM-dependent methyltransferase [Pontiella desulfatans]|uniref:class I SAM-dependent methyltransferase n=1 Tax=Pontiella desulfatans TaxID=2750659 RepID=UPI0014447A00|nr:methyltransferase domain-containing protein [Pontiella desulfatans]
MENLEAQALDTFLDKSWIHLGEPCQGSGSDQKGGLAWEMVVARLYALSLAELNEIIKRRFARRGAERRPHGFSRKALYEKTNFSEFYFEKGGRLPFDDETVDFIFSEHFFEHLFLDEAVDLFRECHRVLKPNGLIRTCVPDADLRTYEPVESVGYPNQCLPYSHPDKHKSRWSVYSLCEALEHAGFATYPLRYCDRHGQYIKSNPEDNQAFYKDCPEEELAFSTTYIQRIDSLIVDGIKL